MVDNVLRNLKEMKRKLDVIQKDAKGLGKVRTEPQDISWPSIFIHFM